MNCLLSGIEKKAFWGRRAAAGVWIAVCCAAMAYGDSPAGKPNFVLMLSDDQGWDGLSVAMHPDVEGSRSRIVETPHLERLAGQGMRFSNAYAPAPVCSPTRISLQTGKSPAQLHWTKAAPAMRASDGYKLVPPATLRTLPADTVTIAMLLKTAGYATAHYGKWHLGGGGPGNFGYDAHDGDTGNEDAAKFVDPNPVDIFGMSERANAFMAECRDAGRPFFIQLSYHALHYSENALKVTIDKYRQRTAGGNERTVTRAAMAENLDAGVGMVLSQIDALKLTDNTYVIYMSDNGAGGSGARAQGGLSGGKGALAEGGIRVPFIVRGPGIPEDSWCHVPINGYDLLPTFCELAGVNTTLPQGIEGGSIVPLLSSGQGEVTRPVPGLLFHFPHYQGNNTPQSALRLGDYKVLKFYESGAVQLFDVARDPGEQKDLASVLPDKTRELSSLLERRLAEVGAGVPVANPQYDPAKAPSGRASQQAGEAGRRGRGRDSSGGDSQGSTLPEKPRKQRAPR
jgi:arylsulfatase A